MTRIFVIAVFTVLLVPSTLHADNALALSGYDLGYDDGYYDALGRAEFDQWLKEDEERARRADDEFMGHSYNYHHRSPPPPDFNRGDNSYSQSSKASSTTPTLSECAFCDEETLLQMTKGNAQR